MADRIDPIIHADIVNQFDDIVPREQSMFGRAVRSSDDFVADADLEREKKKKEKMNEINEQIDRRKAAYDII